MREAKMRKVGFIIYPGYQPMGFAVTAPFEIANRQAAEPSTTSECCRKMRAGAHSLGTC
jgi:transcriptional regulator GlxA family with amidase domain